MTLHLAKFLMEGKKILKKAPNGLTEHIRLFGSSEVFGKDDISIDIFGVQKCTVLRNTILVKLQDLGINQFTFVYLGSTVLAIALPTSEPEIDKLEYLPIYGDINMNGLMNLETLNSYFDYWMDKYQISQW